MNGAWLDIEQVRKKFKTDTFGLPKNQIQANDSIQIRLVREITEWLDRPITEASQASVQFKLRKIGLPNCESFEIEQKDSTVMIWASGSAGHLYGFYELIRKRMLGISNVATVAAPDQPIRMINQWDQTDGSIERGYAGASILFGDTYKLENPDYGGFAVRDENSDPFRHDNQRVEMYARMLASVGINAISLNNVNVRGLGTRLITYPYLKGVQELAEIFRGFGIKTYLAINWEAPKHIAGLKTSDPLDKKVQTFWKRTCEEIYKAIPDFGGFLVKADSEGEPGPYKYGRNHAEGANMLAKALAPYGGKVIWRAFVYNSKQDWRDRSTDRAKAAYENFMPLDGKFEKNVILQIKFGPIDFQTSEPLQPLFGALRKTNQMMEFELSAEYLGHQIDVNYAVPQWAHMIRTNTQFADLKKPVVAEALAETAIDQKNTGFAAVANVGMSPFWAGNPLALANLYGYGRLCWDNFKDVHEILTEWIEQSFSTSSKQTKEIIFDILATSNETYKNYTAPLGVGFMVVPHYHYGVSINGYEYDRWGTYHFADRNGVGVDRTAKTGTGFTKMYAPKVAARYEDPESTPKDLLLFFHHLPYDFKLPDGNTLIQTIYDNHFAGYTAVQDYLVKWRKVAGDIDEDVYQEVLKRLSQQSQNALEWRDQVNTYFYRMSGVPDERGRQIYQ